ncbi:SGNH/GDSL hydrolase family protein [Parapedobacter sp. 2B3]|uniref:SGNH/GDSL hydrolase family protein n=1 Tax=Parapedobacter sp. 2B3 TaxID=3342381 RepID=UPI0035B5CDF5
MKKLLTVFIAAIYTLTVSSVYAEYADLPKVTRVLILGNSITFHAKRPSIGWSGNWGMAASTPDNDYVSRLELKMRRKNPNVIVKADNIVRSFENKYWEFDASSVSEYKDFNPDLIIISIGENIRADTAKKYPLYNPMRELITYLRSNNKDIPVVVVSSFWPNLQVDQQLGEFAKKEGLIYVNIGGIYKKNNKNTAFKSFTNPSIQIHPSDKGMKKIANRIWRQVRKVF